MSPHPAFPSAVTAERHDRIASGAPIHPADHREHWWRSAVIYQIYPRSWADGSGDGVGDLPGITARLSYLRDLGVDAIWLSPFYPSPQADAGYDVADHRDVDPLFGCLEDADRLFAQAHSLGLKVIVDLVPNHTSDEHSWFQEALRARPGSRERGRYIFRPGRGRAGAAPPNNWQSVFGGPAWKRTTDPDGSPGEWYLHLFDEKQPDLNWDHADVRAQFEGVLRFWLDRGVDGFRVDVAHGLVKAPGLPDWDDAGNHRDDPDGVNRAPMWDQPGVHEIYRSWRSILDSYSPTGHPATDRAMVAEAWVRPSERLARYVRPDEFHQAFNFDFLDCPWTADSLRTTIRDSFTQGDSVGAPTTWVLSNHDVVRHATRLGYPSGTPRPNGIGAGDPQPDAGLGLRRARAATMLMLALPGSAYLYQGEELGLPDHTTMPDECRQDPTWPRSGFTERGRDGYRVPMPWEKDAPSYGFGPSGKSWLPQPPIYGTLAVDQQTGVPGSTLELYRRLLRVRRELALGAGSVTELELEEQVLDYEVVGANGRMRVMVNLGDAPVRLPALRIVAASAPGIVDELPTDAAVWMA